MKNMPKDQGIHIYLANQVNCPSDFCDTAENGIILQIRILKNEFIAHSSIVTIKFSSL